MTKDQLDAVLERVRSWPKERQDELAAIVAEIEAEIGAVPYRATPDEIAAIDDGLNAADRGHFASEAEVAAVFAKYRGKMKVLWTDAALADLEVLLAYSARNFPGAAEQILN